MTRIEILLHLSLLQKNVVEMQKQVDEVYSNISDLASLLQKEVTCERCESVNADPSRRARYIEAISNDEWYVYRTPYDKTVPSRPAKHLEAITNNQWTIREDSISRGRWEYHGPVTE